MAAGAGKSGLDLDYAQAAMRAANGARISGDEGRSRRRRPRQRWREIDAPARVSHRTPLSVGGGAADRQ